MKPPPLIDDQSRPFTLGSEIAAGGEGAVFALPDDNGRVAKIYHNPPSPQTVEKLQVMVALGNAKLLGVAAWPSSLLRSAKSKKVAGFVMPRLVDSQPIQHLYNPVMRLKHFPRAGWRFQVRTALNLAAAFDEIHAANCLVGDINQSNVQVSTQALVRLIDCDSFQVRANGREFLCEVGVPLYTPPELQNMSFRGLVRSANHDRFGLAVLIYQLLFVGRHPYAGIYGGADDPTFEEMIAQYRFAQGPNAASWQMAPPPHTPTLADLPTNVGTLFRRSFEPGSDRDSRPRPAEWIDELNRLEADIVECTVDAGHQFWKGQSRCVWCRLADAGGPEYYFGVSDREGTFAVDEAALRQILERLRKAKRKEFPLKEDRLRPKKPPAGTPPPDEADLHRTAEKILPWAFWGSVALMPFGLYHPALCFGGFLAAATFWVWLFVLQMNSPWRIELRKRQRNFDHLNGDLQSGIAEWYRRVDQYERAHADAVRAIETEAARCRHLSRDYQSDQAKLSANAEAEARLRYLRLNLLGDATIPKIGPGRKRVLAANGITTAADVSRERILVIDGFGEALTGNLVAWRDGVLTQFRFDAKTAVSAGERQKLAKTYRDRQKGILADLTNRLSRLEELEPKCRAELDRLLPKLRQAAAEAEQAKADLHAMRRG